MTALPNLQSRDLRGELREFFQNARPKRAAVKAAQRAGNGLRVTCSLSFEICESCGEQRQRDGLLCRLFGC